MLRTIASFVLGSALGALGLACNGSVPKTPRPEKIPAVERKSGADGRQAVSITVYNQSFGLVREVRAVELAEGRVSLEFADVSQYVQPETVALKGLDDPASLAVLEQNYRYDLLTPETLLEKYVGKKIKVIRYNAKLDHEEEHEAEVLATEGGTVLKIGDEITAGYPGRLSFPGVPDNLIAKPTLVWLLASTLPKQRIEVTYLTQGLNWRADYVLVVDDKDERGDLHGWVTLSNDTGSTYENAELKLVAGDVQRLYQQPVFFGALATATPKTAEEEPAFHEEGLFEYHLYTLARPTTLRDREQKQVTLLDATGIGVEKQLVFYGADYYYRGGYGQVVSNQKVAVFLDIRNSEANHMGMPLPKGVVRVYKADSSGARQFIGEDSIDHTPRDEKLRVKMGDAFDVVGDRKQTKFDVLGDCSAESAWEIELRNHKDGVESVEIVEPIGGDWEILTSSHEAKKKDAHTFSFTVDVPARGKTTVTYRVRVRWC